MLVTRIVDIKQFPGARRFAVLDAGMTELMRPALYGAFHRIEPVDVRTGPPIVADIVGPICESTDTFARDRELPPRRSGRSHGRARRRRIRRGRWASKYSAARCRPKCWSMAHEWRVIRRRQTLDDMLGLEE